MRIEIPEFARCCGCVPRRCGILTFGYLNLGFTLFLVAVEVYVTIMFDLEYSPDEILQSSSIYMYRGVGLFSQMWFIMIIYGSEIVFNIILLIGTHWKKSGLIKAYYYYGISTSLAAFACYLLVYNDPRTNRSFDSYLLEFCFAFSGLILQIYLLLLVRSELKKLDTKGQMCFVNHAAEVYVDPPTAGLAQGRNPL